jgi:hypothetical protein
VLMAACALGAAACLAIPAAVAVPTWIRVSLGLMAVFLLPGYALLPHVLPSWSRRGVETIPLAFGLSLGVLGVLTVVAIELHSNALRIAWILLGITALMGALGWRRPLRAPPAGGAQGERWLAGASLAALGLLAVLLYTVGGLRDRDSLWELQEEALHVTIVRKLAENAALRHDNVMYKAGAANTYVYPPYHFGLALASRVARVDPLVSYVKFRPVAAVVALLAIFATMSVAGTRPSWCHLTLLVLVAFCLAGIGGQVPDFYWAQLTPLSHLGDFGLGVLIPLLVFFSCAYISRAREDAAFVYVTPVLIAVGLMVHTRDVLQVLIFLGAFAAVALLFGPPRWGARALALCSVTVLCGLGYQVVHGAFAHHAVLYDAAHQALGQKQFAAFLRQPFGQMVGSGGEEIRLRNDPVYFVSLLAVPLLALRRHRLLPSLLWPGLLACALFIRVPLLRWLVILGTYSEMLMTPARYFVPWSYVLLALGLVGASVVVFALHVLLARGGRVREERTGVTGRERGVAPIRPWLLWPCTLLAAAGVGWLTVGLLAWMRHTILVSVDLLYWLVVLGLVLALAWRRPPEVSLRDPVAQPLVALAILAACAAPVLASGEQPSLFREYSRRVDGSSLEDFWNWYEHSAFAKRLPADVVRFLRDGVPPGQVTAYNYEDIFAIPVLTNHYVITKGTILSTELDFVEPYSRVTGHVWDFSGDLDEAYQKQSAAFEKVRASNPIFNRADGIETSARFIVAYGVDLLIARPSHYEFFGTMAARYPALLHRIYDKDGYAVFRVARGVTLP